MNTTIEITKELVTSIHKGLDKGLVAGLGNPIEGEMCVEALICAKLGLPHDDNPPCVGTEVRKAKIALNDCPWSSNQARAEGMRSLAIAQLNSNTLDQKDFSKRLRLNSAKILLPFVIQKHYEKTKDEKLLIYKTKFESLTALDCKLWEEFYNEYHKDYYNYHYNDYYDYYNYYYNYDYYNYYYGDEWLLLIADVILQTLKEMKSPGCEFLSVHDHERPPAGFDEATDHPAISAGRVFKQ